MQIEWTIYITHKINNKTENPQKLQTKQVAKNVNKKNKLQKMQMVQTILATDKVNNKTDTNI